MRTIGRAILWLSVASLIQGSTFPVQKMVLGDVSPFAYNFLRFGVATLTSLFLFGPGKFKRGFVLGTVLGVAYVFQIWGLQLTTASKSGFIVSSFALMVPAVAYLVEKERLVPSKFVSFTLGGLGLYLLTGGVKGISLGDIFQMFCAVLFAFHVVLITKFSRVEKERDMMFWQFFTAAATNALFGAGKRWYLPKESLIVACYTGVFATTFGIFLQTKYQKCVGNNTTALVFMVQPVFSLLLSAIVLSERMSLAQFLGGIILLLAFLVGTFTRGR